MTLPDLYSTKFRILQRLENNRLNYTFVRVKKMKIIGDEDGELVNDEDNENSETTALVNSKILEKKVAAIEEINTRKGSTTILSEGHPVGPHLRRKTNWDICLEEIGNSACVMQEENKFKTTELSNLCRKARKEVIKKENQNKGIKEYKKLLSARFAYAVKQEFNVIRSYNHNINVSLKGVNNIQGSEFSVMLDLDSQSKNMKEDLKKLISSVSMMITLVD